MASTGRDRLFTDKELSEAGMLTVDLFSQHLDSGDRPTATTLIERFRDELMTMFYSYTGWERSIVKAIVNFGGSASGESAIEKISDYEIAPERMVVTKNIAKQWVAELDEIKALVENNANGEAVASIKDLHGRALALHDGLLSRVSALLSILYEDYGESVLQDTLIEVMQPGAMDPEGVLPVRDKVLSIMHFTRSHLLPFKVIEDSEKVTFMPDPCPSGARLVQGGHYEAPRNNAIVKGSSPLTYGRKDLPVYCCHEPAMEMGSAIKFGIPLFIVDAPEDVGITPCKIYVYKNPVDIPDKYFERLGLKKPEDLIATSG
jgi:hypothetical protein